MNENKKQKKSEEGNQLKKKRGKQNKIAFLLLFDASTHFPTHILYIHSGCFTPVVVFILKLYYKFDDL